MSHAPEHNRIVSHEPSSQELVLRKLVFRKMERALAKLSSGQDAGSVHGFRTTCRRLQTLLEEVITRRSRNQKKLLKALDRIRRQAGKLRDLDMQLAALRSLKVAQEPRRKTRLAHRLLDLRAKHEKRLRKSLNKEIISEIERRLKRAAREVKNEAGRDPLAVAHRMLIEVQRPAGPVTEELLHQYRIVVKRARYAAEFSPKSVESERFIAELKRLQDAVGNWHDWLTLTQNAAKRIGDLHQSSLVAALHNVTGGKFRRAVAALVASPMLRPAEKPLPFSPDPSRKVSAPSLEQTSLTHTAA